MNKFLKTISSHKWIILLVVVLLGAILGGVYYYQKNTNSKTQQETLTEDVKRGDITSSISATGQVATANYLSVTTSVNGIVKEVYVKEGDKIKQGQKLMDVTLDSEGEKSKTSSYAAYLKALNSLKSARNSLMTQESNIAQAKLDFENLKKHNSYQSDEERLSYQIAETKLKSAEADYESKQADINTMQLSVASALLDYQAQSSTILAPSDGVIASVLAVAGSKIENSVSERSIQTVASIKKEGAPIVSLNLGETEINKIKVGQKVKMTLSSMGDEIFTGVVAGIDKVGTSSNSITNYPVTVKFDKSAEGILPNMNVQSDIIIDGKANVLYIPTSAIKTRGGKSTIKVLEKGTERDVEIKTGISDDENTEVVSGLEEGQTIVVSLLPTTGFNSSSNSNNNRGFGIGGAAGFGSGRSGQFR